MADALPVALLVRQPWAQLIVSGEKLWELRGTATQRRGRIGIAEAGSGTLVGEVTVADCIQVGRRSSDGDFIIPWGNAEDFLAAPQNMSKHCMEDTAAIPYKKIWAWVLEAPVAYVSPQPYRHPKGAVIWVKLGPKRAHEQQSDAPAKRQRPTSTGSA